MKPEHHIEAYHEHRDAVFRWALEVRGLDKSQRIVGLHASRGVIELLSAFLHERGVFPVGSQLNHRWFKSARVAERLPDFELKDILVTKIVQLENLSEDLAYGAPKPIDEIRKCLDLFRDIESLLGKLRGGQ